MASAFKVRAASRKAAKARVLLTSPSGGGKTYGALLLAAGMGCTNIVLIDTEHSSADKYEGAPGIPPFQVIDFDPDYTPERYCEAIAAAEASGADCIIIDSTSHEWDGRGGCLELNEELARAKYRGNTWSAWAETTPRHRKFVERILSSRAHIIATARSKTETAQVDDGGRKKVVKLGMKAIARDGLEFEFDVVLDIVHDGHFAVPSKDRTQVFCGDPKPITVETGRRLAEWLAGDAALVARVRQFIGAATDTTTVQRAQARVAELESSGQLAAEVAASLRAEAQAKADALGAPA